MATRSDERYARRVFQKFLRENFSDGRLWKRVRVQSGERSPVGTGKKVRLDKRLSQSLPRYSFTILDRKGRRGIMLKMGYDGAIGNVFGVFRRRVEYSAKALEVLRALDGTPLLISNVAANLAEAVVLADEVEAFNRSERANGKVSLNLVVSFPREASEQECERILRMFCQRAFGDQHLPYIGLIHLPKRGGQVHNPHGHVTTSFRPVFRQGAYRYLIGKELRTDLDGPEGCLAIRQILAEVTTRVMREAGFNHQYTHLSNASRGLAILPQQSLKKQESEAALRGDFVPANERNRVLILANMASLIENMRSWSGQLSLQASTRVTSAKMQTQKILKIHAHMVIAPLVVRARSAIVPMVNRPLFSSQWVVIDRREGPERAVTEPTAKGSRPIFDGKNLPLTHRFGRPKQPVLLTKVTVTNRPNLAISKGQSAEELSLANGGIRAAEPLTMRENPPNRGWSPFDLRLGEIKLISRVIDAVARRPLMHRSDGIGAINERQLRPLVKPNFSKVAAPGVALRAICVDHGLLECEARTRVLATRIDAPAKRKLLSYNSVVPVSGALLARRITAKNKPQAISLSTLIGLNGNAAGAFAPPVVQRVTCTVTRASDQRAHRNGEELIRAIPTPTLRATLVLERQLKPEIIALVHRPKPKLAVSVGRPLVFTGEPARLELVDRVRFKLSKIITPIAIGQNVVVSRAKAVRRVEVPLPARQLQALLPSTLTIKRPAVLRAPVAFGQVVNGTNELAPKFVTRPTGLADLKLTTSPQVAHPTVIKKASGPRLLVSREARRHRIETIAPVALEPTVVAMRRRHPGVAAPAYRGKDTIVEVGALYQPVCQAGRGAWPAIVTSVVPAKVQIRSIDRSVDSRTMDAQRPNLRPRLAGLTESSQAEELAKGAAEKPIPVAKEQKASTPPRTRANGGPKAAARPLNVRVGGSGEARIRTKVHLETLWKRFVRFTEDEGYFIPARRAEADGNEWQAVFADQSACRVMKQQQDKRIAHVIEYLFESRANSAEDIPHPAWVSQILIAWPNEPVFKQYRDLIGDEESKAVWSESRLAEGARSWSSGHGNRGPSAEPAPPSVQELERPVD